MKPAASRAFLLGLLSYCLSPCAAFAASSSPEVRIIQAPANCLVPDVAVDFKGMLHMGYGLDHHAWYIRSTDHGRTFTAPVKVNLSGMAETKMGERGPKLALGADGSIHLVWVDEWAPGVKTFVRYSRSLDGGKTFEPLKTLSAMSGMDGATLTADTKGNVAAFWHVMADPKPAVKAATWLHTARSADNGATFGATEKVQISNLSGLACSMCMMRARAGSDGNVYLAFRSAENSIRDFYVLKGRITENHFTAVRVNQDNWNLDRCPMCGPELTLAPAGQTLCAFMTRAKVFWAISDPALFSPGLAKQRQQSRSLGRRGRSSDGPTKDGSHAAHRPTTDAHLPVQLICKGVSVQAYFTASMRSRYTLTSLCAATAASI
jgi:hypothetical protein